MLRPMRTHLFVFRTIACFLAGGAVRGAAQTTATDASGERLRIRAVSPDGFWGTWSREPGFAVVIDSTKRVLANPGGHFCALRIRRE